MRLLTEERCFEIMGNAGMILVEVGGGGVGEPFLDQDLFPFVFAPSAGLPRRAWNLRATCGGSVSALCSLAISERDFALMPCFASE